MAEASEATHIRPHLVQDGSSLQPGHGLHGFCTGCLATVSMLFEDVGAGTEAAARDTVVLGIVASAAAHATGTSSAVPAVLRSVRHQHDKTEQPRVVVETASERDRSAVFRNLVRKRLGDF